jgi:Uma2 family endonuclease
MPAVPTPRYTLQEYFAREEVADYRSEYYRGEIFAMSGGSIRHNTICANTIAGLKSRLRGSTCRAFTSDQRIRVPADDFDTYPDVSVTCGEIELDTIDRHAIVNPRLLVEVLSPSTESYNRGKKFDLYRDAESLREYILVSQDEPLVERFIKQTDGSWNLVVYKGLEATLELPSISCSIPLAEIYEDVTFGPEGDSPAIQVRR